MQQTQVARVEEFYPRFLERYPTIEALSRASSRQVRESWEGLGYYRRAENLRRLARTVMQRHDGELPRDTDTLRSLPGIGAYTAGAVSTFAYRRPVAAVDTNVDRVLRRVFLPRVGTGTKASQRITRLAQAILPRHRDTAWEFSQGLMDLGATVCVARTPRCDVCPVQPVCATGRRRTGRRSSA